jgi:site-specific recombinase XerD
MMAMLTLQRRHCSKCPDKHKGPNFLKCRGHCSIRICGMQDGVRVRQSLKTRDLQRAARRLAEMVEDEALGRSRKALSDAVEAFHSQHTGHAAETQRKYKRVLSFLATYCESAQLHYVHQISVETMDGYALWRNKANWTWIKEIEILRQFFAFCAEREWIRRNPAKALKRPRLLEANDVVPFTSAEIVRIIAACDTIGRGKYERLRARAMVLLMRFAGLRVSDVVTLSRDHIKGCHLEKRAVKNRRMIRVELHPDVLKALGVVPHPKVAPRESRLFFASGNASVRSLVKGAQRTLAAVFDRAKVTGGHPHRFRHTLASEILGRGGTVEDAANILADSPATIRRHYAKWTPEYQARQDRVTRMVHGTNLAQAEEQIRKW